MNETNLILLVVISATLHLRAEHRRQQTQIYLFKPLTMLLIILTALSFKSPVSEFYRYALIAGLAFSLAGDVFLMLPADRFVQGLASFLVAHLFYIWAFAAPDNLDLSLAALLPLLLFGAFVTAVLWRGLGNLKLPVMVYILVIVTMAWMACNHWLGSDHPESVFAFAGALLFLLSDVLLAFDRFRTKLRGARLYVMSTYFAAQLLIALSIATDLLK